jgi:hypothetical protein
VLARLAGARAPLSERYSSVVETPSAAVSESQRTRKFFAGGYPLRMATKKQTQAAKRNVKKAQAAAKRERTIAKLPKGTRRELGKEAARGRQRGGRPGRALEDRNRQQLYEIAKEKEIPGRSKMGKWDLIKAIRKAR